MEKLKIENVKEVIEFGYALLVAGKEVLVPSIDLSKLPAHIIPLYSKAVPAFDNIGAVAPELADLDSEEAAELVALIASKGVEDAKVQEIIKQSLNIAMSAHSLIKAIKG